MAKTLSVQRPGPLGASSDGSVSPRRDGSPTARPRRAARALGVTASPGGGQSLRGRRLGSVSPMTDPRRAPLPPARLAAGFAVVAALAAGPAAQDAPRPTLNVLLLTVDDMDARTPGVFGGLVPGVTPNIDRLAAEGMRFEHGHVAAAICQPCRQALMTGRFPHAVSPKGGFDAVRADVPTLQEQLHAAGYFQGILGKEKHLAPARRFCWDAVRGEAEVGRDPARFYEFAKEFFAAAKTNGKPFFLMANSHDPHRPFPGCDADAKPLERDARGRPIGRPSRFFRPDDVVVPGFLPDLPDVRRELARYYTSAHRADDTVGMVLRALHEAGLDDSTLVMFLTDNGMAFPFAKTNTYLASTAAAWIVRWPGRVKVGSVDRTHLISGVDFAPTILEATGVPAPPGMHGRSFLPLLEDGEQAGRDVAFTEINCIASGVAYPMRCARETKLAYMWNGWADGSKVFKNESQAGLTFKAMQAAAENDEALAARVHLFQYRVQEELFDCEVDPSCLHNLIADPAHAADVARLRQALLRHMQATADPQTDAFRRVF
ncbi:MAG: sulfatase [Planctomycetota bacterium]